MKTDDGGNLGDRTVTDTTWKIDRDGWYYRPVRDGETQAKCFPDQTMGFVDNGLIHTRNMRLAALLDIGLPVNLKDHCI
jgi:hypothetical protein